jgi:hypothetical protein
MANIVPSSLILVTLMMEALRLSEMSFLTRTTLHKIPDVPLLQTVSVTRSASAPVNAHDLSLRPEPHHCWSTSAEVWKIRIYAFTPP